MMLVCLLLPLSAWVTESEMTGADWKPFLDYIAPYTVELRSYAPKPVGKYEELLERLKKSANNAQTNHYLRGLSRQWVDRLTPVAGTQKGSLGFFLEGNHSTGGEFFAFFNEIDGKMRGEVVQMASKDDALMEPESVALQGNHLVVSGYDFWYSNMPQHAVRTYERVGYTWKLVAIKTSAYESLGASTLRLTPDGTGIEPILIRSRTWPKNLDACHAAAHLKHVEKWKFVDGKPRFDSMWLCDTPYNVLEELYLAIKKSDKKEIRNRSLNNRIYRRLVGFHAKSLKGTPTVDFPGGLCLTEGKVIGVGNLGVYFHFARHEGRWVVTRLSRLER